MTGNLDGAIEAARRLLNCQAEMGLETATKERLGFVVVRRPLYMLEGACMGIRGQRKGPGSEGGKGGAAAGLVLIRGAKT